MFSKKEEKMSVTDIVNSSNVISKETKITGDIKAQGNIRVEGTVEGTIQSKSKIVIGDSALVTGNINATEAEIAGKIEGEIICTDTLYLKKTANVFGNIYTLKLVVENGAVFNGKIQMTTTHSLDVNLSDKQNGQFKKELAAG
jgi:cytoskeletal protein CcmA (bactofilin family)